MSEISALPVVDLSPLLDAGADPSGAAAAIGEACRTAGFFYVVGHGVDRALIERLDRLAREFFALGAEEKETIRMARGGRAWRGWFPVGAELTSGKPDQKEGLYFGAELGPEHPAVAAGTPLHGPNLYPALDGFRETVLAYLDALSGLGHRLMEGIALSLGLERGHFAARLTRDPLILFRIFHYPPLEGPAREEQWSVGEHTDYGLLTILLQDSAGGLQVKSGSRWIEAPPLEGSFVCNLGDMLERMTGGRYRSTPHRVRNASGRSRLSFPFFFDPGWDATVEPLPGGPERDDSAERWDRSSPLLFAGTYGEYLLGKIGKVFPELREGVLRPPREAAPGEGNTHGPLDRATAGAADAVGSGGPATTAGSGLSDPSPGGDPGAPAR
jgi:isopenicillin N synthase-like dioxygenase